MVVSIVSKGDETAFSIYLKQHTNDGKLTQPFHNNHTEKRKGSQNGSLSRAVGRSITVIFLSMTMKEKTAPFTLQTYLSQTTIIILQQKYLPEMFCG